MSTPDQTKFSIEELIICARRELSQRHKVYRRLILAGKMSPIDADRQIALMRAIKENLENQQHPFLF